MLTKHGWRVRKGPCLWLPRKAHSFDLNYQIQGLSHFGCDFTIACRFGSLAVEMWGYKSCKTQRNIFYVLRFTTRFFWSMLTIEIFFEKNMLRIYVCKKFQKCLTVTIYSTRMCLHFVPVETCNCYCNSLHFGTENKHEIVWECTRCNGLV